MALIQPHRDPTGVRHPAAYWRIDEIDLDFRDRRAQVRVSCFHDAEAAKNGFAAVDQQWFYPDGDDFDRYFRQDRASLQVYDEQGRSVTFPTALAAAYHLVKRKLEERVEVPAEKNGAGEVIATKTVVQEVDGPFAAARDA